MVIIPPATLPITSNSRGDKLIVSALSTVECRKISALKNVPIHQRTKQFFGSMSACYNGEDSQVPEREVTASPS